MIARVALRGGGSAAALCLAIVACSGGGSGSAASSASSAGPGAPSASASLPAIGEPPELAAIHAGRWKDPGGGPDLELVERPLEKCFGFDGYTMKLPKDAKTSDIMDARCCTVAFPSAKKDGPRLMVCTDELPVPFMSDTRDSVKNVKSKLFDDPDAFLYEVGDDKGTDVTGWFKKAIGPHQVRCNAARRSDDEKLSFGYQRAIIELCRTIAFAKR